MMDLYDFQRADVDDLKRNNGNGFVAAEPGAGKTVIGAQLIAEADLPVTLIVAPKGTHKKVWAHTLELQAPHKRVRRLDGTEKGKEAFDDFEWKEPGVYLITPQLFTRWKPDHCRPDMMIVDEAHQLGNREKPGGKLLRGFDAGHRVGMSGTMWRNSFGNAWNLLRWIYPERGDVYDIADISFNRWVKTWAEWEYDHFAPNNMRIKGEKEPGALAAAVPCWRQHFKRAECCEFHPEGFLHDLPAPITITETVELTAGQKKAIRQMEDDYVAWLEWKAEGATERKQLITKLPLAARTRIRQMSLAMPSLRAMTRHGAAVLDEDGQPRDEVYFEPDADSPKLDRLMEIHAKVAEPVVASTTSRQFAEMAVKRLEQKGIRAFEWSGAASEKARNQALEDFEAGKYDIVVGVTEAIGTGIDGLQQASGVLVSLDVSDDTTSEIQLESRLDRRGQKRSEGVIHYQIVAEDSLDEGVISAGLERRLKLNESLRKKLRRGEQAA